jgi:hypothetical protein
LAELLVGASAGRRVHGLGNHPISGDYPDPSPHACWPHKTRALRAAIP